MASLGLVVLAAGLGSRFGGIKQLTPIGPRGDVILDYSARDAIAAGFDRIVVVTRSDIEGAMTEHIRTAWPAEIDVRVVCQDRDELAVRALAAGRSKPLGTAHATLVGITAAGARFAAVINADDLYGPEPYLLLASVATGSSTSLVTFPIRRTVVSETPVTRALCEVDAGGDLITIEEGTVAGAVWTGTSGREVRLSGDEPVSMNFWGFGEGILDPLRRSTDVVVESGDRSTEALLPDVVRAELARGERVIALAHDGDCIGLTHPEDAERVRAAIGDPAW